MRVTHFLPEVVLESGTATWAYPVRDLESALVAEGLGSVADQTGRIFRLVKRIASRSGLIRNFSRRGEKVFIVVMMGPAEHRLIPYSCFNESILCCFDCWPNYYDRWETIFRRNRTGLAFFTARQSADYFSTRLPEMRSAWMPEAVAPQKYDGTKSLIDRSVDVLELGRRFDDYHERITDGLKKSGYKHLFERRKGEIIFPARSDLVGGLSETRISVCFPGSLTSPERCGNVETVTHRYFESMASKCVMVGRCPVELRDIFGYDPVIEADMNDPLSQIKYILSRPDEFQDQVERNYRRLIEVGTWDRRAAEIVNEIRGYLDGDRFDRRQGACE